MRQVEKECSVHGLTTHTVLHNGRIKCRLCQKEYQKKHYKSKPAYYKEKAKIRAEFLTNFIRRVRMMSECSVCAEERWWVLDFHHRDGNDKKYSVSGMPRKGYSIDKIKEELRKCDVLCSNCHRDLHFQEYNSGLSEVGIRVVS